MVKISSTTARAMARAVRLVRCRLAAVAGRLPRSASSLSEPGGDAAAAPARPGSGRAASLARDLRPGGRSDRGPAGTLSALNLGNAEAPA